MKRFATANWQGTGKEGVGKTTTQSGVLKDTNYSYKTRFEEGNPGTNPEELIAAAHAGCFTMKLSFVLNEAGFTADNIDTKCTVTFENGAVTESHLEVTAKIPGISQQQFETAVKDAEANCPISKLLNTKITSEAKLVP
ncbi:peroxiredoxin [Niabella ginsenosidivorans]|uniref:Peroxiredoxin n=1 Tax=Niabella ginsenosidivorans TaxID=1176587 RepID=A0A1A9HYP7_9BACT|nr:OsmC family protein [Niabella ginsenosidivorans]ANH79590.1 peroxiredoxin [Niabella ginsenosidivorans]